MFSAIRLIVPVVWRLPALPFPSWRRTERASRTVPDELAADVGLAAEGGAFDRREAFWRQSRRLHHRALPY